MMISKPRREWTVRGHLAVIGVAVALVFAALGGVLGYQAWQRAERSAQADAEHLAEFAAGLMARNAQVAAEQAAGLAGNPGVPPLFVDASTCTLDFQLELFPDSHLDLVRPDGSVACSSAELPRAGATHAGAVWLDGGFTAQAPISGEFVDGITGQSAVAFVALVKDGNELVGRVAIVAPTNGIARAVTDSYGIRGGSDLALIDASHGAMLSDSLDGSSSATAANPLPGRFTASHPVAGTPWELVAGIEAGAAMASTRSMLVRGAVLGACVLFVLVAALVLVNRRIARPLRTLTSAVGGPTSRLSAALASIEGPAEVNRLAAKFEAAIADRDAVEMQLTHQALHDTLTGLPNRALLVDRLTDVLQRSAQQETVVSVVFIDIDRFKRINDSLGHDAGDTVLLEIARRMLDVIPPGATLSRFGGDEFVVVLETSDDTHVQRVLDSLTSAISDPIATPTAAVRVTASFGIATGSAGRRAVDLIRDADNAMYAAKERGRDRAERFTRGLRDRAAEHLIVATEFRSALDRGELRLDYQPKIDLDTGEVVGAEALLRWHHPALGSVPPSTFIAIAEETDAIIDVGAFVLEQACQCAMGWRRAGLDLGIAVNISGRQLTHGALPLQVATALAISGLPADALYLELTETLLMTDTLVSQHSIEQLDEIGVRISIDDFGTGYSSLAYLHRFPVDELKIDRVFISDLTTPGHRSPLVSAMIAMGKALDLRIVAEGVERPEQAMYLQELGCDHAQGYLFARPQHPDAVEHFARARRDVTV